jgi:hypothetical protein
LVGDVPKIALLRRIEEEDAWKDWFENDLRDLRIAHRHGSKLLKTYISARESGVSKPQDESGASD